MDPTRGTVVGEEPNDARPEPTDRPLGGGALDPRNPAASGTPSGAPEPPWAAPTPPSPAPAGQPTPPSPAPASQPGQPSPAPAGQPGQPGQPSPAPASQPTPPSSAPASPPTLAFGAPPGAGADATPPAATSAPPPGAAPGPATGPATAPGWAGAGTAPPPPGAPPGFGPPPGYGPPGGYGPPPGHGPQPPAQPPGDANPAQAAAIALLNLSGLGLGYVLLRNWIGAALCWLATAALLVAALPADVDGVPVGLLVGYGVFLLAAAADGARRGLRATLRIGASFRRLALPLALVLLAVPAGGSLAYGAARDEAKEQALLEQLAAADALVKSADGLRLRQGRADLPPGALRLRGPRHPVRRLAGREARPRPPRRVLQGGLRPVREEAVLRGRRAAQAPAGAPATVDKELLGSRPAKTDEPPADGSAPYESAGTGRRPASQTANRRPTRRRRRRARRRRPVPESAQAARSLSRPVRRGLVG
ncbi:hypothetical protein STANM309S_00405 [Streptomyces tanashiensis]